MCLECCLKVIHLYAKFGMPVSKSKDYQILCQIWYMYDSVKGQKKSVA